MRCIGLLLCGMLAVLSGCTKENLLQGMYEGVRVHNDLQSSPPERALRQESPTYSDYRRMRNDTLEEKQ